MAAIHGSFEAIASSQNLEQNSVYPLPLVYELNKMIFSYLDRAAQLSATRVSKNWRVFTITQKQADQFRRVQKVLQFLEKELQEKYPEVVGKCRECLTANRTAESLYETDFFTEGLCRVLAKELKFVSSEELIRLQGIFGPQEDKPFAFESLLFQARAKQLLQPFVYESLVFHARAKQLPLIENVQERARIATQIDLEVLSCFEKLLSKGAIAEAAAFIECMPRSQEYGSCLEWHKMAFAKLDEARAVQVEELIEKGKFEEAITSADNVTEGGSCCKLLEKIGFEAAFDGDLKAVRRVLDSLKSKYHPSRSKIYQNLTRHFTG